MSLTFYSCSDPPNKLNKTLITLGSTSYFKPIYANGETTTQYILDSGMPAGTNYIYDSDLRRYFFVVEVVHDIAKTITVNCVLDPLYTFRDKLGGTFYFVRGANEVNEMEDNSYPLSDYIRTETYNIDGWDNNFFKNTDTGRCFMLRTASGVPYEENYIEITPGPTCYVHTTPRNYIVVRTGNKQIAGQFASDTPPAEGPFISTGDLIRTLDTNQIFKCTGILTTNIEFEYYEG